ncbi:hypothetical protein NHQ30_009097 [Ciborinia camelliae]|nr:hypothetical protein NHQ30_009097 [Ciborinia camelliae]
MHFSTPITFLAALFTLATATPVLPPVTDAHQAIINCYSGDTCGGTSTSFNVVGKGSYSCTAVYNVGSIEVSENDCATHVWSGSNCEGDSEHITGGACFSVEYASVSVKC